MIGNKELPFTGKGTELGAPQAHIGGYLRADGFRAETAWNVEIAPGVG
jgi:hypothetical protein